MQELSSQEEIRHSHQNGIQFFNNFYFYIKTATHIYCHVMICEILIQHFS